MNNGICNGSQGIVVDIVTRSGENIPIVKFYNGIRREITKHYWQSEDYPCVAVGQYPLILAWALTIHKIQGATLSTAEIDIGNGIFEYGQSYVALSRVKSLEGLYLSSFNPDKVKANPIVKQFYASIQK
jgi:ATP-dependent DNA helicase PIF1